MGSFHLAFLCKLNGVLYFWWLCQINVTAILQTFNICWFHTNFICFIFGCRSKCRVGTQHSLFWHVLMDHLIHLAHIVFGKVFISAQIILKLDFKNIPFFQVRNSSCISHFLLREGRGLGGEMLDYNSTFAWSKSIIWILLLSRGTYVHCWLYFFSFFYIYLIFALLVFLIIMMIFLYY